MRINVVIRWFSFLGVLYDMTIPTMAIAIGVKSARMDKAEPRYGLSGLKYNHSADKRAIPKTSGGNVTQRGVQIDRRFLCHGGVHLRWNIPHHALQPSLRQVAEVVGSVALNGYSCEIPLA